MFNLFADNGYTKNGFATKRDSFRDPATVVCEAEDYDFAFIVYRGEIVAKFCLGNWYLGGDSEQCRTDRMTVAQSLYSMVCDYYDNSL